MTLRERAEAAWEEHEATKKRAAEEANARRCVERREFLARLVIKCLGLDPLCLFSGREGTYQGEPTLTLDGVTFILPGTFGSAPDRYFGDGLGVLCQCPVCNETYPSPRKVEDLVTLGQALSLERDDCPCCDI